jgi:hypothetical protein
VGSNQYISRNKQNKTKQNKKQNTKKQATERLPCTYTLGHGLVHLEHSHGHRPQGRDAEKGKRRVQKLVERLVRQRDVLAAGKSVTEKKKKNH